MPCSEMSRNLARETYQLCPELVVLLLHRQQTVPESAADAERFHQFLLVQRFGYHTDTVVAGAVDHLFRQICLADEDNAGAGGFA